MQNDWAYNELSSIPLWDMRCLRTLVAACMALADNAQRSFSEVLGSRRKAVSRILHHKQTTPQALLSAHVQATKRRVEPKELLLIASDTTSLDFSTHKATTGLGPIGKKAYQQGFFLHSALAMDQKGTPIGILWQHTWVRDKETTGKSEQRRERNFEDKESHKWLDALRAVEQVLPSTQQALLIQDREADVFDFFCAPRKHNIDLLIRASQPRRLEVEDKSQPTTLFKAAALAPVVATKTVSVVGSPTQPERLAHLEVQLDTVVLCAPRNSSDPKRAAVALRMVRAYEPHPPAGVKTPLEWVLLTTLPVETPEAALALLSYYSYRWRIERFHYVLKSGCGYERLQLDSLQTLEKALSLYSIVAWRLLFVLYLSREAPDTSYEEVLSCFEREVLELATHKPIVTVQDVLLGVAKLVHFVSVPSAPHPGVKTLWQGFRKLEDMTQGYLLAHPGLPSAYGTR